ncbi:MAG: DUF2256 domain-containing protein [Pseudomonadota bacterium]
MKKKHGLPEKTCPICERPFAWRKKWALCWDEVRYCSERCRRASRSIARSSDNSLEFSKPSA